MRRQKGEISLWLVGVLMAAFAAIAMAALFSMRYERNIFAEAIGWLVKSPAGAEVTQRTREAADGAGRALGEAGVTQPQTPAAAGGAMRKCVIGGKTVISNVDCARDPASKVIAIHETSGIEAPKAPPPPEPAQEPATRDKMIENATR